MKKIVLTIICSFLFFGVSGCDKTPTPGQMKTYDLEGGKVSFSIPAAPWKESVQVEKAPLEGRTLGDNMDDTKVAVSFRKPDYDGFFAVGTMAQHGEDVKDPKSGKVTGIKPVELEADQAVLDMIAMWVEKRDGKRLKQEWIPVAGTNGFHMVFEVGKPEQRMKGEQLHFTKDGTHYTLSMLVPSKDYDAEVGNFRNMVSSLKVEKPGPSAQATPVKPVAK